MSDIETGSFASELNEAASTLRVVSWNIARGSRLDAIIEFLATANADIILLQESDKHARRTNYKNVASEIAEKLKIHYAFGCEFQELAQGSHAVPAHHGQATLSRWPMADCSILRFQKQSNFWRPRWFLPSLPPLQRRVGGRMALLTHALIPGRNLAVCNLHCESKGGDDLRYSQLDEFLRHTKAYGRGIPVIAGGDFNLDLSESRAAATLADAGFLNPFADLRQASTSSHSKRNGSIDWILLRGPLIGMNPHVHNSVLASDHYPLSLSVRFSESPRMVETRKT